MGLKRKNTIAYSILFALLPLLILFNQRAFGHESRAYHYNGGSIENNRDWMGGVSGERRISDLSLPGTHDTMAKWFPIPPISLWVLTQNMTLRQQLDAGIRVVDMRLQLNIKGQFEMFHGDIPLCAELGIHEGALCRLAEFGQDVLEPIKQFLAAHPTEVIFMLAMPTNGRQPPGFNDAFAGYMAGYKDLLWSPFGPDGTDSEDTNPKLDDVRGKLVILQNFSGTDSNGKRWGLNFGALNLQNNFEVTSTNLYKKWDNGLTTQPVDVQRRDIKHHLEAADRSTNNDIYMNFLSANFSFPCGDPTKRDILEWTVCALEHTVGLLNPPFIASGHSFPFSNDSPREWTAVFSACDGFCGIPKLLVCSTCFPDWPRRQCDIEVLITVKRTCIDYEGTNVLTMNYINNGQVTKKVGMIMADFPGPGLIGAIIGLNNLAPGGVGGGEPSTAEEADIANLFLDYLEELVAERQLTARDVRGPSKLLQQALKKLEKGKSACGRLQRFMEKVERLTNRDKLRDGLGEQFLEEADRIRQALSCPA